MRVRRIVHSNVNEWSGELVEFVRSGSLREFEYHGTNFKAVVTAMESGNNSDTMKIRLHTTGQDCTGELEIVGCWERSEFFQFMRLLATELREFSAEAPHQ